MTYTNEELTALKLEMERRIQNPARACVNSESSFVFYDLQNQGYERIARAYWSWVCSSRKDTPEFGQEILDLQRKLNKTENTIPDWGTYGT